MSRRLLPHLLSASLCLAVVQAVVAAHEANYTLRGQD